MSILLLKRSHLQKLHYFVFFQKANDKKYRAHINREETFYNKNKTTASRKRQQRNYHTLRNIKPVILRSILLKCHALFHIGQVVQTRRGSAFSTVMALRREMTSTDVININRRTKVFQPNF